MILLLCPMNPPSNYILNEATMIEHKAARRILKWPPRRCGKRQLEMSTNHIGLRLPHFRIIRDSMLVNMAYAFMNNLYSPLRTLFKHMVEKAHITAEIPHIPHEKIFMNWNIAYDNPVRDKNT